MLRAGIPWAPARLMLQPAGHACSSTAAATTAAAADPAAAAAADDVETTDTAMCDWLSRREARSGCRCRTPTCFGQRRPRSSDPPLPPYARCCPAAGKPRDRNPHCPSRACHSAVSPRAALGCISTSKHEAASVIEAGHTASCSTDRLLMRCPVAICQRCAPCIRIKRLKVCRGAARAHSSQLDAQVQTGSSGVKVLDLDPRMGGGGRSPMAAGSSGDGGDGTPTATEAAGSSGGAGASPRALPRGRTQLGPGQGPVRCL
jgi:hypothetical protein